MSKANTMSSPSPGKSILKKKKSGRGDDAITQMHTIKEYDQADFNSSYQENDNYLNKSGNNLEGTLSMSVKDPSRPPKILDGLADFLQDEYHKRLGVYSQDSKDLLQFWRNYVSIEQKEQRKLKLQQKGGFDSFMTDNGFEQGGGTSMAVSPKKHKSMVYMGPSQNNFRPSSAVQGKPPVILPKDGVMKKYEQFGHLFEMDVEFTLQKVIQQRLDKKKQEDLKYEMKTKTTQENAKKKAQIKKMQDMFDAYFNNIRQKMIMKKIQEDKEEKMYLESEKKKSNIPKPADASKKLADAQKKPAETLNPVAVKIRAASATPKAQSMKAQLLEPQDRIKKDDLDKIDSKIKQDKNDIQSVMFLVHDVCFMKYQAYEQKAQNHEKQKQDYFASLNEYKKKGSKGILMPMPEDVKEKPPAVLPNDPTEIKTMYQQNRARAQTQVLESSVNSALNSFFQPMNMVSRIILYRDVINKSQRRGKITLHSFYINTVPDDQQLYMFYQKPGTEVKDDAVVKLSSSDVAAKIIKQYEKDESLKQKEIETRALNKTQKKDDKYKTEVMKQVFGDRWTKEGGVKFKNRPDYTVPKDKWKLGKQLKELQKNFPHDRVIQRMVEQEFQTNQPFMYPEEYDLFDQAEEHNFKKNFTGKTKESGVRGAPDFEKEKEKLDNFKEMDKAVARGVEIMLNDKIKKEANLEAWLQKQSYEYKDYMSNRKNGQERKTLRSILAENYLKMIKVHGDTAKARFPHLAYGQDPNSETFKKSFPASFKRYFFKLVKSIIINQKGKKILCKRPATLIMAVGARETKLEDKLSIKSQNTRLNAVKIGARIKEMKNKDPTAWRSRAWRRTDMTKKVKLVFMQFSEIENCKFEPQCGSLASNNQKEAVAGEYFEKFGPNFQIKNPELYKYGKMKIARAWIRTGMRTYNEVLKCLGDAINLNDILQYYRPEDYKTYRDGIKVEQEEKEEKDGKHNKSKSKEATQMEQMQLKQNQNITPEELKYINDAFDQYRKRDIKIPNDDGILKVKELSLAMRKVRFTPGPVELQEISKEVDNKTDKDLREAQILAKKTGQSVKEVVSGIDREWFCKIISAKMIDFQSEKELSDAFNILDEDGSGEIDATEFAYVMRHLGQGYTDKQINEMIRAADTNNDKQIDKKEFISVMKSQGGGKLSGAKVLSEMRTQLKRYLKHKKLIKDFKNMKPHIKWIFDQVAAMNEDYLLTNKKKKPVENFSQSLFDDVWEILQLILKKAESNQQNRKLQDKSKKMLQKAKTLLKEQKENGFDAPAEGEDDVGEVDYRKIYKTIMCPLKDACPKLKKQRWPYTGIKSHAKLGKDCPYAHHAMELAFPQTINMRLAANAVMSKKDENNKRAKTDFRYTGSLEECQGCGNRCNQCRFKNMAKEKQDKFATMKTSASIDPDKVAEKKNQNDEQTTLFTQKFGILKKASIFLHYERPNDAFNEIAKAVQIIKNQNEQKRENEALIQKRWQFKLGLQDGLELPKAYDKIKPEDVTDDFLKQIDSGNADMATLKLYIQNVCPLVRSVYDKDNFLNGLIEDLYFKCEDMIQDKVNDIATITKNKEKLAEINELMDALGSDAEKDPDMMIDNEGNPIKMKKKKTKMCESIQKKKMYKEDGIEMKTKDKYYIDNHLTKQNIQDPKTGTMKCIVCPQGRSCNLAHTAIELDLTPLPHKIKNLNGLIKAQNAKLKSDKVLEPWKPCASDFKREDIPEFGKKKKPTNEEEDDKKNKRKGILQRENVFRKPYDKE